MAYDKYIDLDRKAQKLFAAESPTMFLADLDCNTPFRRLADESLALDRRGRVPCATDMFFGLAIRAHERRVELFIPIAHAILIQELEELLKNPQQLNEGNDYL